MGGGITTKHFSENREITMFIMFFYVKNVPDYFRIDILFKMKDQLFSTFLLT